MSILRTLLSPFSLLYGCITYVRNKLYDWGWIGSVHFDHVRVISVGNITVGGTGKTPHVEYLVRLLSPHYKVAILSRGYKRKTSGFVLATEQSTAADIGDEPCQMSRKFPHVTVAVDANRVTGIHKLKELVPDIQVVLLDDAFQYRKVIPDLSILLLDYHRPLYRDSVFPGGRMREWASSAQRADIMIVSKSPAGITDAEQQEIARHYPCQNTQSLFFTSITYGQPQAFLSQAPEISTSGLSAYSILLVTGIATPKPLENYVRKHSTRIKCMAFPDHHAFSDADIQEINKQWEQLPLPRLLLTTEKDTTRLRQLSIPETLLPYIYYLPIEPSFIGNSKDSFEKRILAQF